MSELLASFGTSRPTSRLKIKPIYSQMEGRHELFDQRRNFGSPKRPIPANRVGHRPELHPHRSS
jgi:hypothetical protein